MSSVRRREKPSGAAQGGSLTKLGVNGDLLHRRGFFFFSSPLSLLLFPGPSSHGNRPRTDNTHSVSVDPADRAHCMLSESPRLPLLKLLGFMGCFLILKKQITGIFFFSPFICATSCLLCTGLITVRLSAATKTPTLIIDGLYFTTRVHKFLVMSNAPIFEWIYSFTVIIFSAVYTSVKVE